jgi:hypothetical protein
MLGGLLVRLTTGHFQLATCFFFIIVSTRLNPAARVFIVVVWRVVLMSKLRHGYATLDRDFDTV